MRLPRCTPAWRLAARCWLPAAARAPPRHARPLAFFAWITALADVIAAAAPFTQPAPLASKVFTAVINIVVGVAVISLLSGVGRAATRPVQLSGPDLPASSRPRDTAWPPA
jgi:hypothetical protein